MNVAVLQATESDPTLIARTQVELISDKDKKRMKEVIVKALELVGRKRSNQVAVFSFGAGYCFLLDEREEVGKYCETLAAEGVTKVEWKDHKHFICETKWHNTLTIKFSGETLESVPIPEEDEFEEDYMLSQMMVQVRARAIPQMKKGRHPSHRG